MATAKRVSFELRAANGGPLRGDVRVVGRGDGRPAVIICHGFKGFKDWGFFPHLADRVVKAGFTAVSFNFGGSGVGSDGESFSEPERFGRNTYSHELEDLTTVCLATKNGVLADGVAACSRLGVFGHSRGGAAALFYTTRDDAVRALVTWSSIARTDRWDEKTIERWRKDGKLDVVNARTGDVLPLYTDLLDDLERNQDALDMKHAARGLRVPWLIVHGEADEAVPIADANELYASANHEITSFIKIPSGTHTFGARHPWAGYTAELEEAMDQTISWFARHLV